MIVKALKELYIALGGSEQDIVRLHTIRQMINAIAVLLGGEGNAKRVSEAIRNVIPVVPTGSGTAVNELIDRSVTEITSDVTKIGASAFAYCDRLTSVNFPNVTRIGALAFTYCEQLTIINFPSLIGMDHDAFTHSGLERVELPNVTGVSNNAFAHCTILTTLILSNSKVANGGLDMFTDTPIANGTGYIYVPDDLVDAYKAARNWSTYAAQIKPISELPTE